MMKDNELVSIIMPSFNTEQYISRSIQSVLDQSYQNWELIIVDDCSTDGTVAIIKSFQDHRIRLFLNEKNSGAAISRNKALREAQGRWIAFLDSDDLWLPEKLERQVAFMEENHYHFSYTEYQEMNENNNDFCRKFSGPKKITKRKMYDYCWPGCLTVMYDKNVIGLIQIADIKKNNDYAMWLKAVEKSDCYRLTECLSCYYKHNHSISSGSKCKLIKYHYMMFRRACHKNPIVSFLFTVRNLFFGTFKKIWYVKKCNLTK